MKGDNKPPEWLIDEVQIIVTRLMVEGRRPLVAVRLVVSALAFVAGSVARAEFGHAIEAVSWGDLVASLAGGVDRRARRRR